MAPMKYITMSGSTTQGGNVVVNGTGFLVSTNSVSLAVDAGTANVAIGKFPEVSTNIDQRKDSTSSKGRFMLEQIFCWKCGRYWNNR